VTKGQELIRELVNASQAYGNRRAQGGIKHFIDFARRREDKAIAALEEYIAELEAVGPAPCEPDEFDK
jgi:hypothetical protein